MRKTIVGWGASGRSGSAFQRTAVAGAIAAGASVALSASTASAQAIGCACDGEFIVGQTVVALVNGPGAPPINPQIQAGDLGTVICGDAPISGSGLILVQWNITNGHDGLGRCDCGGVLPPGSIDGWYVRCSEIAAVPTGDRVDATSKGSLLIYPKVEICYTPTGALIQDTFIDIANDFPADVLVQMYFVNGDREFLSPFGTVIEPGWNNVDNLIELTANEPTYWSVASGLPKGVSPFSVLDPGSPPGRPTSCCDGGPLRFCVRGFVVAFAVDALGRQIRWNHLKGDAVLVNYEQSTAWEYNAYSFSALMGGNGDRLPTPGVIRLDGVQYAQGYDQLLLDFYAVGSAALSGSGSLVTVDTDLTLLPLLMDFRQETVGPVTTKASFDIWNMNEVKFSGTDLCVTCWDERLLSKYGLPNHFLLENLQTDKGRARIDGLASSVVCPTPPPLLQAASLLGVVAKELTFDGVLSERAGTNLHGMGTQSGAIRFDTMAPPPAESDASSAPQAALKSGPNRRR